MKRAVQRLVAGRPPQADKQRTRQASMMPGPPMPSSTATPATALPRFGVYIHFPYCRQRCPYCDFAVAVRKQIPHDRYLQAIRAEARP